MSKVKIAGNASGTGILTIEAPNTNTDRTLTLPDEAGTVLTSASTVIQNGGPAFRAYSTAPTLPSSSTVTTVILNSTAFNIGSCFNTSTYRFTPNVAGYYLFSFTVSTEASGGSTGGLIGIVYKNGSWHHSVDGYRATTSARHGAAGTVLSYANGTTDYFDLRVYLGGYSVNILGDQEHLLFSGALVRAA